MYIDVSYSLFSTAIQSLRSTRKEYRVHVEIGRLSGLSVLRGHRAILKALAYMGTGPGGMSERNLPDFSHISSVYHSDNTPKVAKVGKGR